MLNSNLLQMSLVRKTRKATIEIISNQLEYVAKGHIDTCTTMSTTPIF